MPDEQDYRDLSKLIDDLIAGSKHYQELMHGPETFFTDMDLTNQQKRIADTRQEIITLVKSFRDPKPRPGFHMLDAKPVSADSAQRDYGAWPGQELVVVRADTWDAYQNIVDGIPVFASELLIEAGAKPVPGIDDDYISTYAEEGE